MTFSYFGRSSKAFLCVNSLVFVFVLGFFGCDNLSGPEQTSYAITVSSLIEHGRLIPDKTEAAGGEIVTVTAEPEAGFELAGDILINGKAVEMNSSDDFWTFTMPYSNIRLDAEFARPSADGGRYNVSVRAGAGGSISPSRLNAAAGDNIILAVRTATGYRFSSGSLLINSADGVITPQKLGTTYYFTMPAADVEVDGAFEPVPPGGPVYGVNPPSVSSSGGSVSLDRTDAAEGEIVIASVIPEDGYRTVEGSVKVNDGAVEVSGSGNEWSFEMPSGNVDISADVEPIPGDEPRYSVSVSPRPANGTLRPDKTSAAAGETVQVTASADNNYRLGALLVNNGEVAVSGSGGARSFTMPASAVRITAAFEFISAETQRYGIAVSPAPSHGSLTLDKSFAAEGETVHVTTEAASGYRLASGSLKVNNGAVTVSGSGNTWSFSMPSGAVQISAEFEAITAVPRYTITIASPLTNGSLSTSPAESAPAGETVNITVTPEAGFRLKSGA
jgi:hypothetical protein